MAVIAYKCPEINITVVDSNPKKIKSWNGPIDQIPVYEPGLKEIILKTRGINLYFSENIKESIEKAEIIFMAVNTPTKQFGQGAGMAADLKYVEACAYDIAKYSKSNKIVVEKSTLPVRTAEKIKTILKTSKKNIQFEVISNPEFLAEGTAIKDLFKSDRVLIGGDKTKTGKKAVKKLVEIYKRWIPKDKILTTNVWSSELAKLASNAMLAQRISSINSLSALTEKTGAKIDELSDAIGRDHRIGKHFLNASVGFGGSCFKKDILNLVYLCKHYGLNEVAEYWHQVVKINDYQMHRFAQKIIDSFNGNLNDKVITLLGWAFKPNTNDSRESPSIYVAKKLYQSGASLKIYDPLVPGREIFDDISSYWKLKLEQKELKKRIKILPNISNCLNKSHAIAVLTNWDEFKKIQWDFLDKSIFIFNGIS